MRIEEMDDGYRLSLSNPRNPIGSISLFVSETDLALIAMTIDAINRKDS